MHLDSEHDPAKQQEVLRCTTKDLYVSGLKLTQKIDESLTMKWMLVSSLPARSEGASLFGSPIGRDPEQTL